MQNAFNQSAVAPLSEAEQALNEWNVRYEKQPDGSIFVPKDLDISNRGLTSLPDLRKVKIGGSFACNDNQLTTLKGAPQSVGDSFLCNGNQLITLEGAPQSVGESFWCDGNQLTTLEGAPQSVGGIFWCSNNQLTSLKGAPQSVGGIFLCDDNRLTSLEGAPQSFKNLKSDFGKFSSWQDVPETLRLSPEAKSLQLEAAIRAAIVLSTSLTVKGPLRFKEQGPHA